MKNNGIKGFIFLIVLTSSLTVFSQDAREEYELILKSQKRPPTKLKIKTNPIIQQYIARYQGRGRESLQFILIRSSRHEKMIRRIFSEEGVPEDLSWMQRLVIKSDDSIDSEYIRPLWLFTPKIAKKYGLRKTKYLDETKSFEKATRVMAQHLKLLFHKYNENCELVLAAYGSGEGSIDYAINRAKTKDYWKIYKYLPRETRNFLPNLLAIILIANNPQEYGFTEVKKDSLFEYELARIPPSVSLERIAEYCGTDLKSIRLLNPELIAKVTPPEVYIIRVPKGSGQTFAQKMRKLLNR